MSNLFIGMTGFLGSNLRDRLVKDDKLSSSYCLWGRNDCNLLDYGQVMTRLRNIPPSTFVLLQGSVGGIGLNMEVPATLMEENLEMGMNCIRAAYNTGAKRIILIGTVCSYPREPSTPIVPFKESMLHSSQPDYSNRPYGTAKLCLMEYLSAVKRQFGINHTTLMLANMYGKYDDFSERSSHVAPALIRRMIAARKNRDREITCFGTGLATRDLLWAPDACDAIMRCLNTECQLPEVMNIGTGVETTIKDLAEKIAEIVGYDGEILWDTTKSDGQPRRVLDYSLAKEHLGWEPIVFLNDGLRKVVEWYYGQA